MNLTIQALKIDRALKENSFACLLPYPYLLYVWQRNRGDSVMGIAHIASHVNSFRPGSLMNHKFCQGKCLLIDAKMRKILLSLMGESLSVRIESLKKRGELF